jgi:hypothetical protein
VPFYYAVYTRVSCYLPWLQARVPALAAPPPSAASVATGSPDGASLTLPLRVDGVAPANAAALRAAVSASVSAALRLWGVTAAEVAVGFSELSLSAQLAVTAATPLTAWAKNASLALAAGAAGDLGLAAARVRAGCASAASDTDLAAVAAALAGRRRRALLSAPVSALLPLYLSGLGNDPDAATALADSLSAASTRWTATAAAVALALNVSAPGAVSVAVHAPATMTVAMLVAVALPSGVDDAGAGLAAAALRASAASGALALAVAATLGAPARLVPGDVALTLSTGAVPSTPAGENATSPPAPVVVVPSPPPVSIGNTTQLGIIAGAAGGGAFLAFAAIAFAFERRKRMRRRHAEAAAAISAGVPLASLLARPSMSGFPADALRAAQLRAAQLDAAEARGEEPPEDDSFGGGGARVPRFSSVRKARASAPRMGVVAEESPAPRAPRRSTPRTPDDYSGSGGGGSSEQQQQQRARPKPRASAPGAVSGLPGRLSKSSPQMRALPRLSAASAAGSDVTDATTTRRAHMSRISGLDVALAAEAMQQGYSDEEVYDEEHDLGGFEYVEDGEDQEGAVPYDDEDGSEGAPTPAGDDPRRKMPRWSMQEAEEARVSTYELWPPPRSSWHERLSVPRVSSSRPPGLPRPATARPTQQAAQRREDVPLPPPRCSEPPPPPSEPPPEPPEPPESPDGSDDSNK